MKKVPTHRLPIDSYEGFLSTIIDMKIPHRLTVSRNRRTLELPKATYNFSDTDIKMNDLSLIKKVKNEMIKKGDPAVSRNPDFYKLNKNIKSTFIRDVCEIDITKAYWCAAKKLEYIDQETYMKGLVLDKKSRLVAVGAAATVKWQMVSDGEKYVSFSEEMSPSGRSAFFHICQEVSNAMSEAFDTDCYLFWVDAMFCSRSALQRVTETCKSFGFEVKEKNIRWANFTRGTESDTISFLEVGNETPKMTRLRVKTFTFARPGTKMHERRAKKLHEETLKEVEKYGLIERN